MKKAAGILVALLMLGLCGCEQGTVPDQSAPIAESSAPATDEVGQTAQNETARERLLREIEGAYEEKQNDPENQTTVGMVLLAQEYAEKWKLVADDCYTKITAYEEIDAPNYTAEDLHATVAAMKTNWEQHQQTERENYVKVLRAIYGPGTIVGPIAADYSYEKQKEWALQLVDICEMLRIA